MDLETATTWSNGISHPHLLLTHSSFKLVSFPASVEPARYDGVANMSVSQHLRHGASSVFCNAVCRLYVTESLDYLGECDGADGSTKAVGRANLWSIANRAFATLPLWAIPHSPLRLRGSLVFACAKRRRSSLDVSRRACLAGSPMGYIPWCIHPAAGSLWSNAWAVTKLASQQALCGIC